MSSIPRANINKERLYKLRINARLDIQHHQYVLFDLTFEAVSTTRSEKFCDPVDRRNRASVDW